MNLLHHALNYFDRGLAVVPIRNGSKAPLVPNWQNHRLERAELEHLFGNGHNVTALGVITGQLSHNLIVLDFDGSEWQPAFDHVLHAWPEFESAPIVETGSGKRHIWLTCPDLPPDFTNQKFGRAGAIIELRGNRSNNLAPPSLHPSGGRYAWLADEAELLEVSFAELRTWLTEWAEPAKSTSDSEATPTPGNASLPRRTLEFIATAGPMPAGRRNDELYAAAQQLAAAGYGLDEAIATLKPVGLRIGLSETEIEPSIKSGYSGAAKAEFKPIEKRPPTPTHDELRDRFLSQNPHVVYGLADWRKYQAGLWPAVNELRVKRLISEVIEAAKVEGVKPTAGLLASVTELAKVKTAKDDALWDADPDYLVCGNGTLHIPTKTLGQHNPALYATTGVGYDFDPAAIAKHWELFLLDLAMVTSWGVVSFLQEFAGYALTTDTSHEIAVWLYGPPGSGKSTFLEGLQAMLGQRAGLLGLADVVSNRFALATIPGKTLAISAEQPGDFIASTHTLNALISGEPITVDRKFRDAIEVTPRCKLAWAMNELPRVSDPNSGLFRRVKVAEFPPIAEARRDPQLKELIRGEGAGILNWALVGLDRLRQRGRFDIPHEIQAATAGFKDTNDIPARFVEDCCYTGSDTAGEPYRVKSSLLYSSYKSWCLETGHKAQSSTSLATDWKRLGFEKQRMNDGIYWLNIGLRV